jgi:hypothetical protein
MSILVQLDVHELLRDVSTQEHGSYARFVVLTAMVYEEFIFWDINTV